MRPTLTALLLTLAGSSTTATATATGDVPFASHSHLEEHDEHASGSCQKSSQCEPPLVCCFAAPDGNKLSTGYCASQDLCDTVSSPPR